MILPNATPWFAAVLLCAGCHTESREVGTLEPTLENIQTHVFDQACAGAGCHSAEDRAGDIDLSNADESYAALVGVPATNRVAKENHWLRVKPGEPELSFLCRKMELPGMGEGAAMPPGDMQLDDEHFALVEEWIADGARR